jgi:hypothetical protein
MQCEWSVIVPTHVLNRSIVKISFWYTSPRSRATITSKSAAGKRADIKKYIGPQGLLLHPGAVAPVPTRRTGVGVVDENKDREGWEGWEEF